MINDKILLQEADKEKIEIADADVDAAIDRIVKDSQLSRDVFFKQLAQEGISKNDVQGVGVGVPGPVNSKGIVLKCVNLGWGVFNVEEELASLTGLKVKAGNDANVAALGEMWQGAGKGSEDMVMVTLGTGVGGGVILNGKILAGTNGAAG